MSTPVDVSVHRFPIAYFTSHTLMASVFTTEGDILYMSPHFTRILLGPEAPDGSAVGRNLRSILGEEPGRERISFFREVARSSQPMVVRCVIRGVQFVSHFYPAFDPASPADVVVGALHEVVEGTVDPTVFEEFNYVEAVWNDYGRLSELSPREIEVAVRIGMGMDAKEIAEALTRSLDTVTSHKKAVYAKLGCDNQLKAALIIRRCGLTQRDVPRIARHHRL